MHTNFEDVVGSKQKEEKTHLQTGSKQSFGKRN